MKTYTLFRSFIILILTTVCLSLSAQQDIIEGTVISSTNKNTLPEAGIIIKGITKDVSADSKWEWINELEPQEAMTEIQKMYWTALDKKQYGQALDTIFYRMYLQRQMMKDVTVSLIDSLKLDAERLPQPSKSVIYALMADVYKTHYQSNRMQINKRTRTEVVDEDVNTWDISRLFEESLKYFKMSIREEEI